MESYLDLADQPPSNTNMAIVVNVPGQGDSNLNTALGNIAQNFAQMYQLGSQLQTQRKERDLLDAKIGAQDAEATQLSTYSSPMSPDDILSLSGGVAADYGFHNADPAVAVEEARAALGPGFDDALRARWMSMSTVSRLASSGDMRYKAGLSTYAKTRGAEVNEALETLVAPGAGGAAMEEWVAEQREVLHKKGLTIEDVRRVEQKIEDAERFEKDRGRVIGHLTTLQDDGVIAEKIEELTELRDEAAMGLGTGAMSNAYNKEIKDIERLMSEIQTGYGESPSKMLRELQILLNQTPAQIKAKYAKAEAAGAEARAMLAMAPPGPADMTGVRAASPMLADERLQVQNIRDARQAPEAQEVGTMRDQLQSLGRLDNQPDPEPTDEEKSFMVEAGLVPEASQRNPSGPPRMDIVEGKEGYSMAARDGSRYLIGKPEDLQPLYNAVSRTLGEPQATNLEEFKLLFNLRKRRDAKGLFALTRTEEAIAEASSAAKKLLDDYNEVATDGTVPEEQKKRWRTEIGQELYGAVAPLLGKSPDEVTNAEVQLLYSLNDFYRELRGHDRSLLQQGLRPSEGKDELSSMVNRQLGFGARFGMAGGR